MLPEALPSGVRSLRLGDDRACIAAELHLDFRYITSLLECPDLVCQANWQKVSVVR